MGLKSIRRAAATIILGVASVGVGVGAVHQPGIAHAICLTHFEYTWMSASQYNSLQYKPTILSSAVINGVLYYYVQIVIGCKD